MVSSQFDIFESYTFSTFIFYLVPFTDCITSITEQPNITEKNNISQTLLADFAELLTQLDKKLTYEADLEEFNADLEYTRKEENRDDEALKKVIEEIEIEQKKAEEIIKQKTFTWLPNEDLIPIVQESSLIWKEAFLEWVNGNVDDALPVEKRHEFITENCPYGKDKDIQPATIAIENVTCFVTAVLIYLTYQDELEKVFFRYLQADDFGERDYTKSFAKLHELALKKVVIFGSIPPSDVVLFWVMLIEDANKDKKCSSQNSTTKGIEFERTCFQILEDGGYSVRETAKSGDFGCDLIAVKDELTFCIQCKDHAKPIGVSAVQQATSAKDYYECDFAVVVADSKFTDAALKMANKLNVICLHSKELPKLVNKCVDYV